MSRYLFEWIEFQFWHWFSSHTLKCQPGSTARTSIKELTRFVSSFSSWKSWAPHPPKIFAKLSYKGMQRNVFCQVAGTKWCYIILSLFALGRFATSSCCISHPHRGDHQLFFGLVRWPIPFNPRSIVDGNFWTRPEYFMILHDVQYHCVLFMLVYVLWFLKYYRWHVCIINSYMMLYNI